MSDLSYRRRRINLMRQDPHCYWCDQLVVYFKLEGHQQVPQNFATLDHLNDRIDYAQRPQQMFSIVLSCLKCNNLRAAKKIKELPIEVRQKVAGNLDDNWKRYQLKHAFKLVEIARVK